MCVRATNVTTFKMIQKMSQWSQNCSHGSALAKDGVKTKCAVTNRLLLGLEKYLPIADDFEALITDGGARKWPLLRMKWWSLAGETCNGGETAAHMACQPTAGYPRCYTLTHLHCRLSFTQ